MKQKLLNLKSWLLMMCLLVGVGQSWAEDYTIVFKTNTSDGSSTIAANANLDNVISSGKEYVSAFTSTCSKAYYASISGVKLGSSSSTGTMEFKLADNLSSVNIKSIKIVSAKYGSDTGTLTLYNGTTQLKSGITPGEDYTYTYTNPQKITSIKISTSSKRAYISSITLSTEGSSTSTEQYSYTLETVGSGTTTFKDASDNTIAPNQKVNSGTKIYPTFTPADGYEFTSWEYWGTSDNVEQWKTLTNKNFTITKDVKFRVTYTAVAPKAKYPVTIVTPENGTLTIKDGETVINSGDEVEEGKTLTVEVEPADGYRFKNWGYKDGDAAWVGNLTSTFTHEMPSAPCSFKATFEEIPTYTIAFSVNGVIKQTNTYEDGATVTAPTVEDINGKKFVGWVKTATVNAATAPTYETIGKAKEKVTYYAVFATMSGSTGSGDYVLVESALEDWSGDYLIAYDNTTFANGANGGTDGLGAKGSSVNPATSSNIDADGKSVKAAWGDKYAVKLEEISEASGTYLLKTQDGLYNYQTSNKNGLASTNTRSTAAQYPITINFISSSDVELKLGGSASGAIFHYNTDGYFRFYKDGGQQPVYLYKKIAGNASYSDFTTIPEVVFTSAGTIKISGNGGEGDYYATFSSQNIVAIPTDPSDEVTIDVQAVYVNADGTLTMTDLYEEFCCTNEEMDKIIIPANTGVLIHAFTTVNVAPEVAIEYTNAESETSEYDPFFNMLRAGTVAKETDGSYKFYKLAYKQGTNQDPATLGFYYGATDGAAFDSNPNLAYLAVPETAPAPIGFRIKDDATSIMNVENKVQNNTVYNLAGQRVASKNFKGIVIVNGKKMLNK